MKRNVILIAMAVVMLSRCNSPQKNSEDEKVQEKDPLEVVANLTIRPGNVAVSSDNRVFTTVHPFGNPASAMELIEITGETTYEAFPNENYQNISEEASDDRLDTPLGIRINNKKLWIIDIGLKLGKTRLFTFDIESREEVFRFDFPEEVAPKGSFLQDLAVDDKNGWVYLADIANPGIIVLNTENGEARRFYDDSMNPENVDMIIDEKVVYFGGAPARVAVNPITLSEDRNTLYYGAMSGTTWYQLPAELFRNGASDDTIREAIRVKGPKPVSDGAATDNIGNTYFTNIQHHGIDVLTDAGDLSPIVRDTRIDWPDNVSVSDSGYLYFTVNQLHKSPEFTGGEDEGKGPFYIYRMRL
ncbi:MAG: L-dopachrome tautomerase-related protein [Bacteroidota bacterium]